MGKRYLIDTNLIALCYDSILLSDNDTDFEKIPYLRYINSRKYKG